MGDTNVLTQQDLHNLKMCCLLACKQEKTTEVEMKTLLVLSDKLQLLLQQKDTPADPKPEEKAVENTTTPPASPESPSVAPESSESSS